MKKIYALGMCGLLLSQSMTTLAVEKKVQETSTTTDKPMVSTTSSQQVSGVENGNSTFIENTSNTREETSSEELEKSVIVEETSAREEPESLIITEDNQGTMGDWSRKEIGKNLKYRAGLSDFVSTTKNLPRFDFVDVASYQGDISISDYKNMKAHGLKGVVVKLTEGTTYTNPYAENQVKNAQAVGLKVSVYHFSRFATGQKAKDEAKYFANKAKSLGLPSNTVMVNDMEDDNLSQTKVTENSAIFANELKNIYGFKQVIHYSNPNWINSGYIRPNDLGGKSSFWMAQYLYQPSSSDLRHTDATAWQWGSTFKFVNDSNPTRKFDINIDYSQTFTSPNNGSPVSKQVFIENDIGSIYTEPYVLGTKRQDTTQGMKNQMISITAAETTYYGTWYKFSYLKNGSNKSGWIKSTDVGSEGYSIEAINQYRIVTSNTGSIYNTPFINGTKKIGTTTGMKNMQINVKGKSQTAKGLWYSFDFEKNGKKETGWVKSTDLTSEGYNINNINEKMIILTDTGSIYNTPFIAGGTKKLGNTSGLKNKEITVTGKSQTAKGLWYSFIFEKNGVSEMGWIKSTDLTNNQPSGYIQKAVIINNDGSIYNQAFVLGTKKLGNTQGLKNLVIEAIETKTTDYGTWYKASFNKSGKQIIGWIKSTDIVLANDYVKNIMINKNNGSIYDSPFVSSTKKVGTTSGMLNKTYTASLKATTSKGIWYQISYTSVNKVKTGWIKSTDIF